MNWELVISAAIGSLFTAGVLLVFVKPRKEIYYYDTEEMDNMRDSIIKLNKWVRELTEFTDDFHTRYQGHSHENYYPDKNTNPEPPTNPYSHANSRTLAKHNRTGTTRARGR